MISIRILEEFQGAVGACLAGGMITLGYDILRIFRRGIPHGNFWIGVEDFFFWIGTTLWVFSVLYRENDGSLRMYTILAMIFGMIVYHQTISEPLVRIFGKIFQKITILLGIPLKMGKSSIIFLEKKLKNCAKRLIIRGKHERSSVQSFSGGNFDGDQNGKKEEI